MKALPSVLAAVIGAVAAVTPALQALIAHHPAASGIVGALAVIFAHLSPSPLTPKP